MSNEETDPLLEHEEKDDDDDDDGGDTTNPFQPGEASTPGPSGEEIPMTTMNREKEKGPGIAETSFTEGNIPRMNPDNVKIKIANLTLEQKYPEYGKDGKRLILEVSKGKYPGKVVVIGPRGGQIPLFKADGTINPKLPKTDMEILGPEREILIVQKEKEIEELQESIRENEEIANNENEQPSVRERAREKIAEKLEQIDALENEREELEERVSLREKVKNIFKKYGFTVTAIFLAVGTVIGVIVDSLTKGLKSVAKGVGNGLKDLGKKIAGILPGLIGAIVSFIFKTAGSVISFLGKNAWLLILGVAVFTVERFKKKNG